MNDRVASLLDFGADLQAKHDYPRTPAAFARAVNIRLIPGTEDSSNAGPPAIITYNKRYGLNYRRFTLWHEIAHVLAHRGGYDRLIRHYHTGVDPRRHLEQIINHAAGRLLMPGPELHRVRRVYGETPEAVLALASSSGASAGAAMRRWAWQDVSEYRAAFIAQGNYIEDATACRARLPFRRRERVPELHLADPALSLLRLGAGRVMATVV